jgi:hypothetical protein
MSTQGVVLPVTVNKNYCTEAFKDLITESSDTAVKDSYTESVVFGKQGLIDWLNNDCNDADLIKISFGRYTSAFKEDIAAAFNSQELTDRVKVGRLTTILVACNGNEEVGSYNVGTLQP